VKNENVFLYVVVWFLHTLFLSLLFLCGLFILIALVLGFSANYGLATGIENPPYVSVNCFGAC